ncbi:MAG: GDP-mannose 4,6-dehydratase [Thermoleophilaceae bacterium]
MPHVALVTGGGGFAGRHLVEHLRARGEDVVAPTRTEVDLLDPAGAREAIAQAEPARVFHLAALASVGRSWEEPRRTLAENQEMALNLLEAVNQEAGEARVLIASSGEVYGPPAELPVTENAPLRPQSPYALSKASTDMLGALYSDARGLALVRTRAFNHAGPGQSDTYVVGTLTRQVAEAEAAGQGEVTLHTGNPGSARDFIDVRDVVAAYELAISLEPGAYNVASERAVAVSELIEIVRTHTQLDVRHEVDPERVREHDVREVRGSAAKLRDATGWEPRIPLEQTVSDALAEWRRVLAR